MSLSKCATVTSRAQMLDYATWHSIMIGKNLKIKTSSKKTPQKKIASEPKPNQPLVF
jgi:hypothetical protein